MSSSPPCPRVSVLIAAHDAETCLPRALRSVLSQSVENLEVIVVDDASRDGTAALVEAVAARDPRVRLIRSARNLGPGGARNLGLEAARAPWIALLDSDDAYLPARLARLLRYAEAEDADLVADNLLLSGPERSMAGRPMLPPALLDRPRWLEPIAFLRGNLPIRGHPRVALGFLKPIISRRFLNGHALRYRDGMRFAEDFDLYLRCLLEGGRFLLVPEPGYAYSVRGDSLTARHGAGHLARLRALDRAYLHELPDGAAAQELRDAFTAHLRSIDQRLVWRLFTRSLSRGRLRRAVGLALRSPGDLRLVLEGLLREGPAHLVGRVGQLGRRRHPRLAQPALAAAPGSN